MRFTLGCRLGYKIEDSAVLRPEHPADRASAAEAPARVAGADARSADRDIRHAGKRQSLRSLPGIGGRAADRVRGRGGARRPAGRSRFRAGDPAAGTAVRDPAASLSQPLLPGRSPAARGAERFRRAGAGALPGSPRSATGSTSISSIAAAPATSTPRPATRWSIGRASAAISPISGSPCAGRWASRRAS